MGHKNNLHLESVCFFKALIERLLVIIIPVIIIHWQPIWSKIRHYQHQGVYCLTKIGIICMKIMKYISINSYEFYKGYTPH